MKISKNGIDFIKQFEGIRLKAYKAVPTEKYYTIGIGHYGQDVKEGMTITEKQAEDLFKKDVERFEKYVEQTGLQLNQNQFDALVSFTYNCGPGTLKKLINGRTLKEIPDAMLNYNHSGGKELAGLTRRRKAERELFLKETDSPKIGIIIGSARADENKKYSGGKAGDQRQKDSPDYSGEVSMQSFYEHSKGWYILRPKDAEVAMRIAAAMITACNNSHVGYDQLGRLGIMSKGTDAKEDTECDCGTLVRKCVLEASGVDPGNFTTANEAAFLKKTGLFEEKIPYKTGTKLYTGDVLVTKTKGHTVVVTAGESRSLTNTGLYPRYTGSTTSIVQALKEVGETDTSFSHRRNIACMNNIHSYSGTAYQNTQMLNLLKQGKLIRY
ncbi:MAG: lysozyme [Butyrivibrio sp.]|nr:lysozyme [Butyrivibrio sp.]